MFPYSKIIPIADKMILTNTHHCLPLEGLELKSPMSALSSSSTLCDHTAVLKKAADDTDKGSEKTTNDELEDGLAITIHSHDTSRATTRDGLDVSLPTSQEKENRCEIDVFDHAPQC
jgi:hypothetical protein